MIFTEEELKTKAFDFVYNMDIDEHKVDRVNVILDFVTHIVEEKREQQEAWMK